MEKPPIRVGGMYSNGIFGRHWSVRQVLSLVASVDQETPPGSVTYKVLAGSGRRRTFTCTRQEFARWAIYEVARNENSWVRLG